MIEAFRRQTALASYLVKTHLKPGDSAIDATVGNGTDTLMMAECVGEQGYVYAYDIQDSAIENTKALLAEHNLSDRVELYCQSHAELKNNIKIMNDPFINVVMFNLGFLPGGDKDITTQKESTMMALNSALSVLKPQGIITVCAYCHEKGLDEIQAIESWAMNLGTLADVHRIETINHQNAPKLYLIRKR